jgi:predicted lipoprotein with Yx(FWY)xxD motif
MASHNAITEEHAMTRSQPVALLAAAAAVPLAAFTLAASGNNDASGATVASKTVHGPTLRGANNGKLGKILVNAQGRTLYLFKKDTGTKSTCNGACAAAWPPLRATGKPVVGKGATASKARTSARSDGKPQVVYNGHPLYTYVDDKKPGDTHGQGIKEFGALWYAVSPAGKQVSGNGH